MKALLAIGSLSTLVLLLVAAGQENYFAEWRETQREYRRLLLERAENANEVKAARGFPVEIRQIVVPDLGRTDRCVTCHLGVDDPRMAEAAQPFTTHPGPLLEDHDIDAFGCTVCHQGQGLATNATDAHAREEGVFWEWPVLPARFVQSSCGACHDAQSLGQRGAPLVQAGYESVRSSGCLGCHKLQDRGGPLGPALDAIGDRSKHAYSFAHVEGEHEVWNWHREHFASPSEVVPESKMPAVEGEEEIDGLTAYLLSLQETNLTERMTPADRYAERYRTMHPEEVSGAELYGRFCVTCHEDGSETVWHESLGVTVPAVRHPDLLAVVSSEFLVRNMRWGRPGTQMPGWGRESGGLTDAELEGLAEYLLEARVEERAIDFEMAADTDAEKGRELFEAECTDCHALTPDGVDAPWLGSSGFQSTYSDALIGHTIRWGREDTLMIGYGEEADGEYTAQEISDLVAFIRTLG